MHLFATYRGKFCQKLLYRVTSFKVIEKRADGDARACKAKRTVHDVQIAANNSCHAFIIPIHYRTT